MPVGLARPSDAEIAAKSVDPDDGREAGRTYTWDFFVIGGGSGGLAAAKRAAEHGARTALADFVRPSPQGTKWGLGGTCVNVGCIPKKLMHTAALHGEHLRAHIPFYGWGGPEAAAAAAEGRPAANPVCDWDSLRDNVTAHVRSLNFGYTSALRSKNVKYYNAYARFVDPHTIELENAKGVKEIVTARRILIATGGRPTPLAIPGGEHCVTSDDIFRLQTDPKRTLVVGASYVALECAGFLTGIGRSATVMMRSIPLRGFDTDMAGKIVKFMEEHGTSFVRGAVPTAVRKQDDGTMLVDFENTTTKEKGVLGPFETVLVAVGRKPETSDIQLDRAGGVNIAASGKIVVDAFERTTVPHIYAIGDIIEGGLELTPVAISAGRLLADRLFAGKRLITDYETVPTTVFTPLEYGCVGLSEEAAQERFGVIEVYHTYFQPLEWTVPHLNEGAHEHWDGSHCYMKLIVNPFDNERVLGFHVLAPNAGEITQGVAVALKCGATKAQFDATIGIHPTIAEDMTQLTITKSSGESAQKTGC